MVAASILCVVLSVSVAINVIMQLKVISLMRPLLPVAQEGIKAIVELAETEVKKLKPVKKRKYVRKMVKK